MANVEATTVIVLTADGLAHVGRLFDANGRHVITGPNLSPDIQIDGGGKVQTGGWVESPFRITHNDADVRVSRHLWIGLYEDGMVVDPVGSITLARGNYGAQPGSFIRLRKMNDAGSLIEHGRIGLTKDDELALMRADDNGEGHDTPLIWMRKDGYVGIRDSVTGESCKLGVESGQLVFYDAAGNRKTP